MPTLRVQNDTGGLADANSYVDVAFADTYHDDRANTAWASASAVNKITGLIRAWQYIDTVNTFFSARINDTQNTEFPRNALYDRRGTKINPIPTQVKYAQSEYALRALSKTLAPDPVFDDTGGKVISKSESVPGAVSESITYSSSAPISITRPYPAADILLKWLIFRTNRLLKG